MIIAISVAAVLLLLDLRLGFSAGMTLKILFTFSKDGTVWLDFDLLPTIIGAVIVFAVCIMLQKEEGAKTNSLKKLSVALILFSAVDFAQLSGRYIMTLNTSGKSTLNPGVVADILYVLADMAAYFLAILALGTLIDVFQRIAVHNHPDIKGKDLLRESDPYAFYFRTFCAFPIFIRIFMFIANFDRSGIFAAVLALVYYAICIFCAVVYIKFVKTIYPLLKK